MQRSRVTPRVTAKFSMSPPGARRRCQPPTPPLTAAARHHLPLTALHSFAVPSVASALLTAQVPQPHHNLCRSKAQFERSDVFRRASTIDASPGAPADTLWHRVKHQV